MLLLTPSFQDEQNEYVDSPRASLAVAWPLGGHIILSLAFFPAAEAKKTKNAARSSFRCLAINLPSFVCQGPVHPTIGMWYTMIFRNGACANIGV